MARDEDQMKRDVDNFLSDCQKCYSLLEPLAVIMENAYSHHVVMSVLLTMASERAVLCEIDNSSTWIRPILTELCNYHAMINGDKVQ